MAALLGAATGWIIRREAEQREVAQVLDAIPGHVLVLDTRGHALWEAGGGPRFALDAPAGAASLDKVLKQGLRHLPGPMREAGVNDMLSIMLRADGQPVELPDARGRWFRLRQAPLPAGRFACFATAVTDPRADRAAREQAQAQLRAVTEQLPLGVWALDAEGATVFANARCQRLFAGALPASFAAAGLRGTDGRPLPNLARLLVAGEMEAELLTPGAEALRVVLSAARWDGADGRAGVLLSLLDVTAQRAAQARADHLSGHDVLTGLANRRAFLAALEGMIGSGRGGVLMLLDLDHFKATNDRFGHAMGDALLREAAARLRASLRPSDLVARLAGDEFAVLALDAHPGSALMLAGRVRAALRPPLLLDGGTLSISASIGLAIAPLHGQTPGTLLRAADLALREAKAQGRDQLRLFEPALRERAEQRALLREALAEALAQGELELHLQPQFDMQQRRVVGAEALLRWNSRRLKRWVSPAEIIPAAMEAGLMGALDRHVLARALAILAAWRDHPAGPSLLAINISVSTLHEEGFAAEVAQALEAAGVPPERLEIEIPEDLAAKELPVVQHTLQALCELGVSLSLDDFGAGHSGLPHVVGLPVQRLKLDRSITARLPDDPKAGAVLRATTNLAAAMGITMVGEGVEIEAQAAALRAAGCQILQGWMIARPMPPAQLLEFAQSHAAGKAGAVSLRQLRA